MSINNFDVMKEMARANGNIKLAPLSNLVSAKKVKAGTHVTIGFPGDVIKGITFGEYVGGFILCDKKEFESVKAALEAAEATSSPAVG